MRQSIDITKNDARWAAVVARDKSRDGQFFYAVGTTGVYCRPSCAARPRRENVSFHETAAAARQAGFRPCKRCRPDRETLLVAIAPTALGLTLAAQSRSGVCAILFGKSRAALMRDLRERFPDEALVDDGANLPAEIVRLAAAPQRGLSLPLDPRGTAFQKRVWTALRDIPAGRTSSYAEVAGRIGAPRAVRAVAQACAANPLALAVPCHRVVGSDGTLSGYRWGADRKRALLDREAAVA